MGKQFDYFNAFLEMGRHSLSAGELLKETLETYDPAALKERMAQIHAVEHSADTLKHQLTDQLIREFLPPIEREGHHGAVRRNRRSDRRDRGCRNPSVHV